MRINKNIFHMFQARKFKGSVHKLSLVSPNEAFGRLVRTEISILMKLNIIKKLDAFFLITKNCLSFAFFAPHRLLL